jgi:hypothetical protein
MRSLDGLKEVPFPLGEYPTLGFARDGLRGSRELDFIAKPANRRGDVPGSGMTVDGFDDCLPAGPGEVESREMTG